MPRRPTTPSFQSNVPSFFRQAERYPSLDRDAEQALARRWRSHRDPDAAERLVLSHMRQVVAIAARYRRYQVPFGDLVSEGSLGLLTALDRYDPDQNTRFITYAGFWIRARIVGYVLANWSIAKSGKGPLRSKLFFALRRERARTLSEFGEGEAADAELERRMGINIVKLKSMLTQMDQHDVSLDQPIGPEREDSLLDLLPATTQPYDAMLAGEQAQARAEVVISAALQTLDPREYYIAKHRLMAPRDEELSLAEIGRQLGVTRERARQLEARAKAKLKAFIERRFRKAGANPCELIAA